eukprot:g5042.t1
MMISRAFPVCKVARLAGGAHGYEGSVISIGQDISSFSASLPWLANSEEMPVIIIQPPDGGSWAGRQFKVNLRRVERTLNYLIRTSRGTVMIDMDRLQAQLAALPREDNDEVDVMHLFHTVREPPRPDEEEEGEGEGEEEGDAPPPPREYVGVELMPNPLDDLDDVSDPQEAAAGGGGDGRRRGPREGFIPSPGGRARSEEEALREALEEMTGYRDDGGDRLPTIQYPRREDPLREDTPWLASMCFPTLFPEGVGDPFGGARLRDVSIIGSITHLVRRSRRPGEDPEGDGSVPNEEYERVQLAIREFLGAIGLTARNPSPPDPDAPISEEARARGMAELEKDLLGFDRGNLQACESRYTNLLNAAQCHARHGSYCLRNNRYGAPDDAQGAHDGRDQEGHGRLGGDAHGSRAQQRAQQRRVREASQMMSVELQRAEPAGGVTSFRDLSVAYSHRMEVSSWADNGGGRPASDDELREMNYCTFAATYKLAGRKRTRDHERANRVGSYVPVYSNRPSNLTYADYYRNQLVKLRPLFGELWRECDGQEGESVDTHDEAARATMIEVWRQWALIILALPLLQWPRGFSACDLQGERRRRRRRAGDDDDDDELDLEPDDEDNLDGLHGWGGRPPEDDVVDRRWSDGRDGVQHDWAKGGWSAALGVRDDSSRWARNQRYEAEMAVASARAGSSSAAAAARGAPGPTLNEKQALALSLVVHHAGRLDAYRAARDALDGARAMGPLPPAPEPLRLLLTGTAGTGKTVDIRKMVRVVGRERFKVLAPTGNAACAIEGKTIHGGLRIPVQNCHSADPSAMGESALRDLQQRMQGVDFTLVDEFSMVGQDLLGLISARGKQAVEGHGHDGDDDRHLDIYGGLSVILVGDPGQLPPVGAEPMWKASPGTSGLSVQGLQAWMGMNQAVELTQVMRHLGPEQAAFRAALLRCECLRVAEGTQTAEDWELMKTRFTTTVSRQEADTFDSAVLIFPTNELASDWNWRWLQLLNSPVARINAHHSIPGYTAVSSDRFRGLEATIYLAVGARVFVDNNVRVSASLANGAIGEVVHLQWAEDAGPPSLPEVVWVQLENYRGPQCLEPPLMRPFRDGEVDLTNVVPVTPIDVADDTPGSARRAGATGTTGCCVRTQIPITLAFGITIHKSQGNTLLRFFLDIGRSEKGDGQSFTALSRCRSLENMLLEPFSLERFMNIGGGTSLRARLDALDRVRAIEDRTRRAHGLPVHHRPPRPQRPAHVRGRGGAGTGAGAGGGGRGGRGGIGTTRGGRPGRVEDAAGGGGVPRSPEMTSSFCPRGGRQPSKPSSLSSKRPAMA